MAIKMTIAPVHDETNVIAHELDQSLITVGRSKSCHIELDHPEISRRHFIVRYEDDAYVLIDENSRHGTTLDGQKLEPWKSYVLGEMQSISVPGFIIMLHCDGEKPRLERTTVVARKLLDDLLQEEIRPRDCPVLRANDSGQQFKFTEEKTTFVLGSASHADFVVHDEAMAKKHVAFMRDIFGIRIIPMPGHEIHVNGEVIAEPCLLANEATITIGPLILTYHESEPMSAASLAEETAPVKDSSAAIEEEEIATKVNAPLPSRNRFAAFDRIFMLAFFAVCAGALWVTVNLIRNQ